jgi:sugar lactone lactonase YvrE
MKQSRKLPARVLWLTLVVSGCAPFSPASIPCQNTSNCPNGYTCNTQGVCQSGSQTQDLPTLTRVAPNAVPLNSPDTVITLTGTNFVSSSTASLGSTVLTTQYVSPTSLTATVPAAQMTTGQVYPVTVVNPAPHAGTSAAQSFSVNNPVATITSISPTGGKAFNALTLQVSGANFVTGATVGVGNSSVAATVTSSTQLSATLPASVLNGSGTWAITVSNPPPGGGGQGSQNLVLSPVIQTAAGGYTGLDQPVSGFALPYVQYGARRSPVTGELYLTTNDRNRVMKVDSAGILRLVAGSPLDIGSGGYTGDNGPATAALVDSPRGLDFDSSGNLYFVDQGGSVVRMVDDAGTIHTVVGSPSGSCSNTDGPVATAQIGEVNDLRISPSGDIYLSVGRNCGTAGNRIRKISKGYVSTLAGNGTSSSTGDNGPASLATVAEPVGLELSDAGVLYVAEHSGGRVRQLTPLLDGGMSIATLYNGGDYPWSLAFDATGYLFYGVWDWGYITRLNPGGTTTGVAGNNSTTSALSPDGTTAISAEIGHVGPIFFDALNRVHFFMDNPLPEAKLVTSITGGTIESAYPAYTNTSALQSFFYYPSGVAVDSQGGYFVADNGHNQIYRVSATGVVTLLAGSGDQSGGPLFGVAATSAAIGGPDNLWYDAVHSDLYFTSSGLVWKVDAAGLLYTVAGAGNITCSGGFPATTPPDAGPGYNCIGDSYLAVQAELASPSGVTTDPQGSFLYISEFYGSRIRQVDLASGIITTVAGSTVLTAPNPGTPGDCGTSGPTTGACLNNPAGLAVLAPGKLLVADNGNGAVRVIDMDAGQVIDTGWLLNSSPYGLAVDSAQNAYVFEWNSVVERVSAGVVSAFAGQRGTSGFSGDFGPATAAELGGTPGQLALSPDGKTLYIADPNNDRIRQVGP